MGVGQKRRKFARPLARARTRWSAGAKQRNSKNGLVHILTLSSSESEGVVKSHKHATPAGILNWSWAINRSIPSIFALAALSLVAVGCAKTTPNVPTAIPEAATMAPSQTVGGRMSWVRPDTDFSKYGNVMIAPVTIYGGTDTDWGDTSDAARTEIASYLQQSYTKSIAQSMRIVSHPAPNTLLLRMKLVGVESNVAVLSTVSPIYPGGLVLNITKQASSSPGTFSGSVTYALMLYDSTSDTLLAAAVNRKYPEALNIGSTLSTVSAAKAGIDQGAAMVGKTIQLLRSGEAKTGS
jgi:uncharacterized protein DUF3313